MSLRREMLLRHVAVGSMKGLEIGPLDSPLVSKAEGPVKYLDYLSYEELQKKYANHPKRNASKLVRPDYVIKSGSLSENITERFDYIVACHVIEHVADVITWLEDISRVLAPDGILFLAVPDKRYTFDLLRPNTAIQHLLNDYYNKAQAPDFEHVFEHKYMIRDVTARDIWAGTHHDKVQAERMSLKEAYDVTDKLLKRDGYVEVHCHVFTRDSFVELMGQLDTLGLVDFEPVEVSAVETLSNEFIAVMRNGRRASGRSGMPSTYDAMRLGLLDERSSFMEKDAQDIGKEDRKTLANAYVEAGDYQRAEEMYILSAYKYPFEPAFRIGLTKLYSMNPDLLGRKDPSYLHCPCCEGSFPRFLSAGKRPRPDAACPNCGCLERHRLLWMYLQQRTNFTRDRLKVLHFAPERIFQEIFSRLPNLDYLSCDLDPIIAMVKMDITNIEAPDNTFDVVLCIHVLEHIPDDRKAMSEMFRVMKKGAWAILQAPIDYNREKTYEDFTITTAEARTKAFGQYDHVRWYGRDYKDRLEAAGFVVTVDKYSDSLSDETIQRCRLTKGEEIYVCQKP